MKRRAFLAIGAAGTVLPAMARAADALPVPASGRIGFSVLRNGSPIGVHTLTFTQAGDALSIAIVVDLAVKFAGLSLFRYRFDATERWQGGVWQSADSTINNNGKPIVASAHRVDGGFAVTGTEHAPYLAPPETHPATYWNKPVLFGPLLNLQTAQTLHETITDAGWFSLPEPGGPITAQRYDLAGKLNLSVYYDRNNAWSGLAFQRSGTITYQKLA